MRNLEKRAVKKGADFLRGALPRVPERVGMRMKPRLWWLWAVCAAAVGGVLFTRLQLTQTARRSSHTAKKSCVFPAAAKSYGQGKEDAALYERYFCATRGGTFVEMGALDGVQFSNTKFFEDELEWSGLLIEAQRENVAKLMAFHTRPRSTKLASAACSPGERTIDFVGSTAVGGLPSTMSSSHKKRWITTTDDRAIEKVPCAPLGTLLEMAGIRSIDFFVLDVEGAELQVLETMDWSVPVSVWVVEMDGSNATKDQEVRDLLHVHGYFPPSDGWSVRNLCQKCHDPGNAAYQTCDCPQNEVFESKAATYVEKKYVDDFSQNEQVMQVSASTPGHPMPGGKFFDSITFRLGSVEDAAIVNPTSKTVGLVVSSRHIFSLWHWHWTFGGSSDRIAHPQHDLAQHSVDQFGEDPSYRVQKLFSDSIDLLDEEIISFDMVWSEFFQHIVLDSLPRAALACEWIHAHPSVNVGVAGVVQQRLILEVCNISDGRFRITRGANRRYKTVYMPYIIGSHEGTQHFLSGLSPPGAIVPLGGTQQGRRIVFLWRSESSLSRRSNQDEMVATLRAQFGDVVDVYKPQASYGYSTHHDAKAALRDAKVIVGVHGGALANMIFAPTRAIVVEINIRPDETDLDGFPWRGCFYHQAIALGFKHVTMPATGFSYDGREPAHVNIPDFRDLMRTTFP